MDKIIEVYTEKPVPVYREVNVPYDVIVEKPIEKIIQRDVVTDIIKEKPVERVVEIPIITEVEIPIERVYEKEVHIEKER